MLNAKVLEELAIGIAFPNAVMNKNTIPQTMVTADSAVKVPQHDESVLCGDCLDDANHQVIEQSFDDVFRCDGSSVIEINVRYLSQMSGVQTTISRSLSTSPLQGCVAR